MAMATGSILQEQQRELLQQERRLVNELQTSLVQFAEIDPTHVVTLRQVMIALDELFLLVIVGEFNAGKSATINALLRAPVLKEGVIPTTQAITLLRYGEEMEQQTDAQGMTDVRYPAGASECSAWSGWRKATCYQRHIHCSAFPLMRR
jgi:ABC-type polysaccharide/polyol phosphate transport system ATPase subunit